MPMRFRGVIDSDHTGTGRKLLLPATTTSEVQCHKQLWTMYITAYTGLLIVFLVVNTDISVVVPSAKANILKWLVHYRNPESFQAPTKVTNTS